MYVNTGAPIVDSSARMLLPTETSQTKLREKHQEEIMRLDEYLPAALKRFLREDAGLICRIRARGFVHRRSLCHCATCIGQRHMRLVPIPRCGDGLCEVAEGLRDCGLQGDRFGQQSAEQCLQQSLE